MASPEEQEDYQQQIQGIQRIFAAFDADGTGRVKLDDVGQLMQKLGRDPSVGAAILAKLESKNGDLKSATFEEVVQVLKQIEVEEEREVPEDKKGTPAETTTPLSLMKRLNEYRKQCETYGEYVEAKKARMKLEELKSKELTRQRQLVQQAQDHEMREVEHAQKQQFLEFSSAWDRYMADYESTAYMSLERLRERHAAEFAAYEEKLQRMPNHQAKFSREFLELKRKQHALAKLGHYAEAQQVKVTAQNLEKWETAKNTSEHQERIRRLQQSLRQRQQRALAALLKRIQRDRGEQIRQRQADSQRLIQRNKNLKTDLKKKQHLEFQRAESAIRSILSQPEHAQRLLEEHDPAFVARSAATGELPALIGAGGRAKWKGPQLPANYVPPGGIERGVVQRPSVPTAPE
jgi:hypothetical protein